MWQGSISSEKDGDDIVCGGPASDGFTFYDLLVTDSFFKIGFFVVLILVIISFLTRGDAAYKSQIKDLEIEIDQIDNQRAQLQLKVVQASQVIREYQDTVRLIRDEVDLLEDQKVSIRTYYESQDITIDSYTFDERDSALWSRFKDRAPGSGLDGN